MGRRTICTPELVEELCEVLRGGNFICVACDYVGIDESTYYGWVKRAEAELERVDNGEEPTEKGQIYVRFFKAVTRARKDAERKSVESLRKSGDEDWRAHAFWLERSFPDRWGKRSHVDVTSKGQAVNVYLPTQDTDSDDD